MSHTRERRRANQSDGKESGEEAPRLSRLAASPFDFALAATPRALLLQREPARRLFLSEHMPEHFPVIQNFRKFRNRSKYRLQMQM